MVPYEPVEGQLIALQFRLLRAARAMLDPMLNLGLIDARARRPACSTEDVVLSRARWRSRSSTATRSARRARRAATSTATRASCSCAWRPRSRSATKFDRLAFNNFLLDQGLLPPDLLAKAVREEFVPKHRGTP